MDKYKDTGNYRFDAVNTIHHPATFSPQYIQLIVFGNHGIDSNGNPGSCFQIAIQDHSVAVRNMYTPTTYNTWRIVSDDSKVAHLSGANNFDTIPTVNNNPLLLASSLPSDLARTGQANTFSSLQTFSQGAKTLQTGSYDDANSLVNEGLYYNTNSSIKNGAGSLTTGYIQVMSGYGEIVRQIMYSDTDGGVIYERASQTGGSSWSDWTQIVTWDQLPSNIVLNNQDTNFTAKLQQNGQDVALANNTIYRNPNTGSVSSANTFTQPQTFSIAPTIKDASKDKGDNQAATMADLKSVADKAWYKLDNKYIIPASGYTLAPYTSILYKIDDSTHTLYLSGSMILTNGNATDVSITIQLGSIVKSILIFAVDYLGYDSRFGSNSWNFLSADNSSTNLTFTTVYGVATITGGTGPKGNLSYVTYDELV